MKLCDVKIWNHIIIKLVFFFISLVNANSQFEVSITPSHVHIRGNEEVNITCSSKVPVEKCEIRVFNLSTVLPTLVQVEENKRSDSVHQTGRDGSNIGNGTYSCVITLPDILLTNNSLFAVACRARTGNSAWNYDYTSVFKSSTEKLNLEIYNRQLVTHFFRNGHILIKSSETIQTCTMILGNRTVTVPYQQLNVYQRYYRYFQENQGVWNKQCGVVISNAGENDNGIFTFVLQRKDSTKHYMEKTFVLMTVTKPPNPLMLSHEVSVNVNGTKTLTVTCTMTGGRPAANMSWYLGSKPLPVEHLRNLVNDGWLWPFNEQMTSQQLTMTLTQEHINKEVKCEVSHLALQKTQQATFRITKDLVSVPTPTRETTATVLSIVPTTSVSARPSPMPSSIPLVNSDKDEQKRLQAIEKKIDVWFVVLTVLLIILTVLIIVFIIGYCWHNVHCWSCCKPKGKGAIKYRRSFSPSVINKEVAPCQVQDVRSTASSCGRSSVATGVEFAEIRASMVQRCVDNINASAARPSSETGEVLRETMCENSLYLRFDDEHM